MRFATAFLIALSAAPLRPARAAKLDVTDLQAPPLDVKHPGYKCLLPSTKPAISKGARAYKLYRKTSMGPFEQPAGSKPRVLHEMLVVNNELMSVKHYACSERWVVVRVSVPTPSMEKPGTRLSAAEVLLGRAPLTKSPSAAAMRDIRRVLRSAAKIKDLSGLNQSCDPEKDIHCLTICLDRRHGKCRIDVSIGFDSQDVIAGYIYRP